MWDDLPRYQFINIIFKNKMNVETAPQSSKIKQRAKIRQWKSNAELLFYCFGCIHCPKKMPPL